MDTDFDCCVNDEHTEPPTEPEDTHLRDLTDEALHIAAEHTAWLWRRANDTGDGEAAEHLEGAVVEMQREVERRLTILRAQRDAMTAFLAPIELRPRA